MFYLEHAAFVLWGISTVSLTLYSSIFCYLYGDMLVVLTPLLQACIPASNVSLLIKKPRWWSIRRTCPYFSGTAGRAVTMVYMPLFYGAGNREGIFGEELSRPELFFGAQVCEFGIRA